jgi:anthranilate 1,2-dioxygenase small subunit
MTYPIPGYEQQSLDRALARDAYFEVADFHARYCDVADGGDLEAWPTFFTDDCLYEVRARENAEQGLPVGLVYCEGRKMIRDRAYAVKHTQMFAPRYLQHVISNIAIRAIAGEEIRATAGYVVLQTLVESPTTILQSGRYFDTFARSGGTLRLKERRCIYDTTLIANDLVYPI